MLKGRDLVVLLWLLGRQGVPPTLSEAAGALDANPASVHRSISRLLRSSLVDPDRRVQVAQADELMSHGLPYLFPPVFGGEARGVPTAWAAAPLRDLLADVEDQPLVWAHPEGVERGIALGPLHPSVPDVALRDPVMHERLALVDALRLGDARARRLAHDELKKHYAGSARVR